MKQPKSKVAITLIGSDTGFVREVTRWFQTEESVTCKGRKVRIEVTLPQLKKLQDALRAIGESEGSYAGPRGLVKAVLPALAEGELPQILHGDCYEEAVVRRNLAHGRRVKLSALPNELPTKV